jgi:hypothetical protein
MTPPYALVGQTRRRWLATASSLRELHPELAAKITLARLTEGAGEPEEMLAIAFTRAEYERLSAHFPIVAGEDPGGAGQVPIRDEAERTIADIETFLGIQPKCPGA